MSFYIFVSSHGSALELHPDNTPSDFQITLADPIRLNGNWEVALQEVTYVHSFANMNQVGFVFERPPDLYKDFIEAVDIPNDVAVSELVHDHKHFHLTLFRKKMKMTIILKKDPDEKRFFYCTKRTATELGFNHHAGDRYPNPNRRDIHYIGTNALNEDIKIEADFLPARRLSPDFLARIYIVKELVHKDFHKEAETVIPTGFYPTPKSLLDPLNGASDVVSFTYKEFERRFQFKMHKGDLHYTLKFQNGLDKILGFAQSEYAYTKNIITAEQPPSVFAGSNAFFIYSSICEDIDVGNQKLPLLRAVPIKTSVKFGDIVNMEFKSPVYVGLNSSFITNIAVSIRNDYGVPIQFTEGKTQLVLHFRMKL